MPKVKIGEKVVAGESSNGRKEFTNGHKFFDSFAARALTETQTRERRAAETFDRDKATFVRSRNPIIGEPTPRTKFDAKGEIIERTGELLFSQQYYNQSEEKTSIISPSSRPSTSGRNTASRASRSINVDVDEQSPGNPLKRSDAKAERISSLQNMQDNLAGELEFLKTKIAEKQQRLSSMESSSPHVSRRPF